MTVYEYVCEKHDYCMTLPIARPYVEHIVDYVGTHDRCKVELTNVYSKGIKSVFDYDALRLVETTLCSLATKTKHFQMLL